MLRPSLVAFAFSAGLGTFFAPCAYPLLPGYVSYYLGETVGADGGDTGANLTDGGTVDTGGRIATLLTETLAGLVGRRLATRLARAAVVGSVVSLGFFLVYGVLAGVTAAVGSQLLGRLSLLELVVGVVLIVAGTATASGYDPPTPTVRLPERRRSVGGFLAFGVLYAAAAAGCTAPIFVAVGVRGVAAGPVNALAVFGAYAAGTSLLMITVTVAVALGRDALLGRLRAHTALVERGMGVLLAVAGVVQLYFFPFRFDGLSVLGLT
ncbi:MAG: cytochrome c biogenesis protein [halophilic archaeon J07HB67]|jgi:Cytochrome C biogenesis protein transmembrane region.|nr:MAG: cytochrome c biogenesis protein [halophilic archaeon J07HB67]